MAEESSPAILGRYAPTDHGEQVTITLLNFPLQVYIHAVQHHDELLREFALLALSPPKNRPGHSVPAELTELINTLGIRYGGEGERTDAVRDDAIARGDTAMDLSYVVPRSVGQSMRELEELLTRADQLCRDGELLTVAATPLQRDFWSWFINEFVNQAAGQAPTPWTGLVTPDF